MKGIATSTQAESAGASDRFSWNRSRTVPASPLPNRVMRVERVTWSVVLPVSSVIFVKVGVVTRLSTTVTT